MECEVCCGVSRTVLECATCQYATCRNCCRRLVERDASCAKCGARWSAPECKARLGDTFYRKVFRVIRGSRYLQRELLLVPQARRHADKERKRRYLSSEIRRLTRDMRTHHQWHLVPDLRVAQNALSLLMSTPVPPYAATSFFGHCPHPGCSGLLSEHRKCGTCDRGVCERCGMESHVGECSRDALESVALIRNTTRACAGCGAPSVRVDGCFVMWCSACHVFWNWEQGRVIERRGTVPHNPDHRAWVATRRDGRARELHDLPCGGFPERSVIHLNIIVGVNRSVGTHTASSVNTSVSVVLAATQSLVDAQYVVRPRYPLTYNDDALFRMRVKHLLGDFASNRAYATSIESYERGRELKVEVASILETFVHAGLDIVQRFAAGEDDLSNTASRLVALHGVTSSALSRCASVWDRKVPTLTVGWTWTMPYARG